MSDTGKTIALIKALAPAPEIDPEVVEQSVEDWLDDHPEATTTVQDGSITKAKLDADLKAEIEKKADNDGLYEQMTVGNAEQLVATVGIEDKVPYNFRTAGGSADIGDRLVDKLVGGTIAWNQLVQNGDFSDGTNYWAPTSATYNSITAENGELNCKVLKVDPASNYYISIKQDIIIPENHVVLASAEFKPMYSHSMGFYFIRDTTKYPSGENVPIYKPCTAGKWNVVSDVVKLDLGNDFLQVQFDMRDDFGYAVDDVDLCRNINIFDLTQMFGPTIADYVYSLEQATAGAGVAWFRKLFPKDYYAYDAGSLQSVQAKSHVMRGFNAWDEEWEVGTFNTTTGANLNVSNQIRSKNIIKILPNTTYYWNSPVYNWTILYDANGNVIPTPNVSGTGSDARSGNSFSIAAKHTFTTPANAYGMRFYTGTYTGEYKNDICINLSWDGERDGEYEPYTEHVYPLDDSLTLRGIPKLDANNNLYYDGDTYESDGTVTRKYGIVDLGTLTWDYNAGQQSMVSTSLNSVVGDGQAIICTKYSKIGSLQGSYLASVDKVIAFNKSSTTTTGNFASNVLVVKDTNYTDAATFKTAMSGVYLVYELATPTTEEADPFQNPQIVDDFGTEEYIDAGVTASTPTRDVAIPVGHETTYQANLRAKLEMAPESPDGDGDYIVRQTNGQNEYVELVIPTELPTAPTTDGNYLLKCTVSSGTATYTWEAQS